MGTTVSVVVFENHTKFNQNLVRDRSEQAVNKNELAGFLSFLQRKWPNELFAFSINGEKPVLLSISEALDMLPSGVLRPT